MNEIPNDPQPKPPMDWASDTLTIQQNIVGLRSCIPILWAEAPKITGAVTCLCDAYEDLERRLALAQDAADKGEYKLEDKSHSLEAALAELEAVKKERDRCGDAIDLHIGIEARQEKEISRLRADLKSAQTRFELVSQTAADRGVENSELRDALHAAQSARVADAQQVRVLREALTPLGSLGNCDDHCEELADDGIDCIHKKGRQALAFQPSPTLLDEVLGEAETIYKMAEGHSDKVICLGRLGCIRDCVKRLLATLTGKQP